MTMDRGKGLERPWVKASRSTSGTNCVELRRGAVGGIDVRDSKDPDGPVLSFSTAQFTAWLDGAGSGEFTPLTD
jgi:hypothetical protein